MFEAYLSHLNHCDSCIADEYLAGKLAAYWAETYEPHRLDRAREIGYVITLNHATINALNLV